MPSKTRRRPQKIKIVSGKKTFEVEQTNFKAPRYNRAKANRDWR